MHALTPAVACCPDMHAIQVLCAAAAVYCPSAQSVHSEAAELSMSTLPDGQSIHAVVPTALFCPAVQAMQELAEDSDLVLVNWPAGQSMQAASGDGEYGPALHSIHAAPWARL